MDFQVDIPALPPFVARLRGAQTVLRNELATSMQRLVILGQNAAREGAPVDTGRLRNSITSRVELGGTVRGVWGTNITYAETMEEGRRAGAPMPPAGALIGWMSRHGIDPSAEFVVRRAIGRHGIKGRHFFRASLDRLRPIAVRELNAAYMRALKWIGGAT